MLGLKMILLRLIPIVLREEHRLQRCRIEAIQIGQAAGLRHVRSMA